MKIEMSANSSHEPYVAIRDQAEELILGNKKQQAFELWREYLNQVIYSIPWHKVEDAAECCIGQLPDFYIGYLIAGIAKQRLDDFEGALKDLSVTLVLSPQNMNALHYKTDILSTLGRYDEAIEFAVQMTVIEPSNPANHRLCASLRSKAGYYKDALIDLDRTLAIDPDDFLSLIDKGTCLGVLGAKQEANLCFSLAEKNLKTSPMSEWMVSILACLHLNRGEFRKNNGDKVAGTDELLFGQALMKLTEYDAFWNRNN